MSQFENILSIKLNFTQYFIQQIHCQGQNRTAPSDCTFFSYLTGMHNFLTQHEQNKTSLPPQFLSLFDHFMVSFCDVSEDNKCQNIKEPVREKIAVLIVLHEIQIKK